MSYASDRSLVVGSKIKALEDSDFFSINEILTMVKDDGIMPDFRSEESGEVKPFCITRNWEHYKEKEKDVTSATEVEDEGWIAWGGSSEAPVAVGTKVDVKYYDGSVAIGIGSQDRSSVYGCNYTCCSWYCNVESPAQCSIVAYRIHKPAVASQEAITERLEDSPSVGIDYSVTGSTASQEPLITITQEVKYTVVIKGTTFTFTQDELDALAEELLGFTTL